MPAAETLDLSSMPVDDSYDGPMMEGRIPLHASFYDVSDLRPDMPALPVRDLKELDKLEYICGAMCLKQ